MFTLEQLDIFDMQLKFHAEGLIKPGMDVGDLILETRCKDPKTNEVHNTQRIFTRLDFNTHTEGQMSYLLSEYANFINNEHKRVFKGDQTNEQKS